MMEKYHVADVHGWEYAVGTQQDELVGLDFKVETDHFWDAWQEG